MAANVGPPPDAVNSPGSPVVLPPVQTTPGTLGPGPSRITCRSCNQSVITRVEDKPSSRTHITACLLCLFFCWLCICCPYCMKLSFDTNHYCTNCGVFLGTYRRQHIL